MERFKVLFIAFVAIFFLGKASAQQYTPMTAAGYQMKRIKADSTLHIPSFCGVPTLRNSTAKDGALAMDTCNNKLYKWTNQAGWSEISGGGGGGGTVTSVATGYGLSGGPITGAGTLLVDSATLSNKYLRIVDTANKWVSSVTKVNDSTIRVVKDGTTSDLLIRGNATATTSISDTAKVVIAKVHNAEATTLTRGTVVYLYGANGDVASVKRANNKLDATSSKTFGMVRRDIAAGDTGYVTTQGQIEKLNLGSYTEGDVLWLDSLDGQFTKVKPVAPYHGVFVGIVERANAGNGLAYIKPQNGYEMSEIHDVKISGVVNNNILVYSDTQSLWKNRSIYTVIDTATMLANYGRKDYNTLSVVLNNGNTATDKLLQLTASTTQAGYMTTKTSSARGSLFNNRLSIEDLSGNSNYTYLDIDTATKDPYLMIHQNSSLKECRVYSDNLSFKNLSNASIVQINAPTSSSNRTINFQDKSYTIADSADVAAKANLSQSSYTFLANNTNATANMSTQVFNDQGSQTYTGTITWGSINPPSGTTNHSYRWTQVGKMVTLSIQLVYGTVSTGNQTSVTMTLPTGLPSPNIPSGLSSGDIVYHGTGSIYSVSNTLVSTTSFVVGITSDGTIRINRITAATARYASATITYWTN